VFYWKPAKRRVPVIAAVVQPIFANAEMHLEFFRDESRLVVTVSQIRVADDFLKSDDIRIHLFEHIGDTLR
jgi:hypothetical protein